MSTVFYETFLTDKHFLKNYYIFRNGRIDARGGGVALLIDISIKYKYVNIWNTKSIENISAKIL